MDKKSDKILVTRTSMPTRKEYMDEISSLWDSRWITNVGEKHIALGRKLKEVLGVREFELFTNGHSALEIGLESLDIRGEIITTPFTFISSTNAIVRTGSIPVFADIDKDRWTIDPKKIESLITNRTRAILGVHVYGIPCHIGEIEDLAKKYGLKVIYDAAHTFGVRYKGLSMASYGDMSMYSFHATKVFHTVEGGGLSFRDSSLKDKIRHLRDFGLCPGGEDADQIGSNAKLCEFHAAMGLCNLRHVDEDIRRRKTLSELYDTFLKNIKGIRIFPHIDELERNYAYYPVVFDEEYKYGRDEIAARLASHNIFARKYFHPLTSHFSAYQGYDKGDTPVAKYISSHVLCLPIYADLREEDVERICRIIL